MFRPAPLACRRASRESAGRAASPIFARVDIVGLWRCNARVRAVHRRRARRAGGRRAARARRACDGRTACSRGDGRAATSTAPSRPPAARSPGPGSKTPPTERSRLLTRSPTRSWRTARSSPSSRRGTSARRSARSRPRSRRAPRTSASSPPASRRIAGRSNPIGGSLLYYSLREPVGVAGQIVPWNYPFMLATWKLRRRSPPAARSC